MPTPKPRTLTRSAKSGRIVSPSEARRHPSTTVVETLGDPLVSELLDAVDDLERAARRVVAARAAMRRRR